MALKRFENRPNLALSALKALNSNKIPAVIVGGAALALHGIPRSTLGIDIIIPADQKTIHKLLSTMDNIGLHTAQREIISLANNPNFIIGQWISFADSQGYDIIDVFFETPKSFTELKKRSIIRRGQKITYRIASLEDLKSMKKKAARPIDLADIALIEEKTSTNKPSKKKK